MPEERPTAESETAVVPADLVPQQAIDDMSEEILVEEVSIDGMCGVY